MLDVLILVALHLTYISSENQGTKQSNRRILEAEDFVVQ
jgi:hypothetical protein